MSSSPDMSSRGPATIDLAADMRPEEALGERQGRASASAAPLSVWSQQGLGWRSLGGLGGGKVRFGLCREGPRL